MFSVLEVITGFIVKGQHCSKLLNEGQNIASVLRSSGNSYCSFILWDSTLVDKFIADFRGKGSVGIISLLSLNDFLQLYLAKGTLLCHFK